MLENKLKRFAYAWYSRFDKGTNMDALLPFLPDEKVEFAYPTKTLSSIAELAEYSNGAFAATQASAHILSEIFVHPTADENVYEVITPHTYHLQQATGQFLSMVFVGRMRIHIDMKTTLDPEAKHFKVVAYKAALVGQPGASGQAAIDAIKSGDFNVNDAKAFVHQWFALIDAGDADSLENMTSSGKLGIDLMGNKATSRAELKAFLTAQGAAQNFSSHTPERIRVTPNDEGFQVQFVLNFTGDIKGTGALHLSNVTTWQLVIEDGELRLRDYTLVLL